MNDDDLKELLINLVERIDNLEKNKEEVKKETKKVETASKIDEAELKKILENLLLSIDDLLGFLEGSFDVGMMKMPMMLIRMVLNYVLTSVDSLIGFLPKDLLGSVVEDVKTSKKPKGLSLASAISRCFPV